MAQPRTIATRLQRHLRSLWARTPASRAEVLLLWACGLALGALAFRVTLTLPLPAALAGWAAAAGLALLVTRDAEPLLWEAPRTAGRAVEPAAEPAPPPPALTAPAPPPVPALLDLVAIPGGTFRMGSPPATEELVTAYTRNWAEALGGKPEEQTDDTRRWLGHEQPPHQVALSPFLMARVPVTRGQWRAVMPDAPEEWSATGDDDTLPATHVDWPRSLTFCNTLSQRERLTPCYRTDEQGEWHWDQTADGYRLPTEAEWEYACRAGTDTQWFWGDDPAGAEAHAWYRGNADGNLKPVGGKKPNAHGLHDLAGLVWEWCWDHFGTYPEDSEPPPQDPAGAAEGDARVVRGGSFWNPPEYLRPAGRDIAMPDFRVVVQGLRCVPAIPARPPCGRPERARRGSAHR